MTATQEVIPERTQLGGDVMNDPVSALNDLEHAVEAKLE
jgi:hypothetical protein